MRPIRDLQQRGEMRKSGGRPSGRVRMVDVARVAGVSQPTASRVLAGDARVTDSSREAVLSAARKMGYVVNRAASSLAGNRTNSIGFIIAEPGSHLWGNPYFPRLMSGITAEARARGLQLVLFMDEDGGKSRQLADYLRGGHVDGALMITSRARDPLLRALLGAGVPVVVGGRPVGVPGAAYVDVDNKHGADVATTHLLDQGYRHVAIITGPTQTAAGADRLAGYRRALKRRHGVVATTREVVASDFSHRSGEVATDEVLTRWPETDAIFAAADLLCYGALVTLKLRGIVVPTRMGLVSFDDSEPNQHMVPALTSIAQPVERLGESMVRLLATQIEGTAAEAPLILKTQLVQRESSRR